MENFWTLSRKEYWDDPEYLAGLIFHEMLKEGESKEAENKYANDPQFAIMSAFFGGANLKTGVSCGIGSVLYTDIDVLVVVSCKSQTVEIKGVDPDLYGPDFRRKEGKERMKTAHSFSFGEFCSISPEGIKL